MINIILNGKSVLESVSLSLYQTLSRNCGGRAAKTIHDENIWIDENTSDEGH